MSKDRERDFQSECDAQEPQGEQVVLKAHGGDRATNLRGIADWMVMVSNGLKKEGVLPSRNLEGYAEQLRIIATEMEHNKEHDWQRSCEIATAANEKLAEQNHRLVTRITDKCSEITALRELVDKLNTEKIDLLHVLRETAEELENWIESEGGTDHTTTSHRILKTANELVEQIERR